MIKITKTQLQKLGACSEGIEWFNKCKLKTLKTIVPALVKNNHADYARWLLSNLMTHTQQLQWAIYCAELVIKIFEKKYPEDNRPRKAIQAAKDFLAGNIDKATAYDAAYAAAFAAASAATYAVADAAAYGAAYAAIYAAAYAAIYAAANAAYAATYAASAATYAASAAANAAADVANTTTTTAYAAHTAARVIIDKKIVTYAMKLLGE